MKSNYLNSLEREFYFVTDEEREQILSEYEVHFDERLKEGINENEVIKLLGSPKTVAIEYATELGIQYSTIEKHMHNLKHDSSMFFASIKTKFHKVKNEQAAKRKNTKAAIDGGDNGQGDTDTYSSDNNLNITHDTFIGKILKLFGGIVYLIISAISFSWNIIKNFAIFICGLWFCLGTISLIILAIALPFFITITNFKLMIWFLIYGSIFSLVILSVIISLICFKYFGVINYE